MKKIIKRLVLKVGFITKVYLYYKIFVEHQKVASAKRELEALGRNSLNGASLLNEMRKKINGDTVVHCIGSGQSLLDSIHLVETDHVVLGCSFACIAPLNYDFYFIEFGGRPYENLSLHQKKCVENYLFDSECQIFFKRFWYWRNQLSTIERMYGSKIEFLEDYVLPCHDGLMFKALAETMLNNRKLLLGYESSLIQMMVLCCHLNVKNVVVHGLDFGGEYFFDVCPFDSTIEQRPPLDRDRNFFVYERKGNVHHTAATEVGIQNFLPVLLRELKSRGVNVWAASKTSGFARIAAVYGEGN